MTKYLNMALDVLLFIVPLLEMTQLVAIVPPEYLPAYMLVMLVLRRSVRMLQVALGKEV